MSAGALREAVAGLAALPPEQFWPLFGIAALVAAAALALCLRELRRARDLEDLPTSRVRSAAQGYVELCGRVRWLPGPDIVSPLSGSRCVWWSYRVEHSEADETGRRRHWETLEQRSSDDLFVLGDETGDCVVDPEGAEVLPSLKRRWQGSTRWPQRVPAASPWISFGEYRYTERLLQLGDELHALGWFRTQNHEHRFDETADLRELLAEWKQDRRALLRRFDADGDGRIDAGEWESARRAALQQIRAEQVQRSLEPDVHVLCNPPDGRRYLLSTVPQEQLARRHRYASAALLGLSLLLGALLLMLWQARGM